jgi:hypothetical protein
VIANSLIADYQVARVDSSGSHPVPEYFWRKNQNSKWVFSPEVPGRHDIKTCEQFNIDDVRKAFATFPCLNLEYNPITLVGLYFDFL